jgi:hypothetical protein
VTLGVLSVQKPKLLNQEKVWFEDFCRCYLEILGWILLTVSARDVEFVIREVLIACTYRFKSGGLQFLKPTKVTSPF